MPQNAGGDGGGGLCSSNFHRKLSNTGDLSRPSLESGVPTSGMVNGSSVKETTKRIRTTGTQHTHTL